MVVGEIMRVGPVDPLGSAGLRVMREILGKTFEGFSTYSDFNDHRRTRAQ